MEEVGVSDRGHGTTRLLICRHVVYTCPCAEGALEKAVGAKLCGGNGGNTCSIDLDVDVDTGV